MRAAFHSTINSNVIQSEDTPAGPCGVVFAGAGCRRASESKDPCGHKGWTGCLQVFQSAIVIGNRQCC